MGVGTTSTKGDTMQDFYDNEFDQFTADLNKLEAAIGNEDQRLDGLDYLGTMAKELGGILNAIAIQERTPDTRDYTDGSGTDTHHAATAEMMKDLAASVRDAADRSEATLIVATVLKSVINLTRELTDWNGAPAQIAAKEESSREGMTRDQVLAYLASKGRAIKPGTWSGYVARNQAPQPARKVGRTPLWDPTAVAAFADGTWKA